MHWIQTIRENLELSQAELAHYLRLSVDMIKSVETDRRELPYDSLQPAITLYQAMKDVPARGPASSDPGDLVVVATDHRVKRVKRLHREYSRKLERYAGKLEEMQRSHARACSCLDVYQFMAQSLTPPHGEDDRGRLQLIQWKIEETTQRIKDTDAATQDLLTAEITDLENMKRALEASRFFPQRNEGK